MNYKRRLLVGTLLAMSVSAASCGGEFETNPRIRIELTNESSESLYVASTGFATDDDAAFGLPFRQLQSERSREIILGGTLAKGQEPGGCLDPGEAVYIFRSPSGIVAPLQDPETSVEITSDLVSWVPDAVIWRKLDENDCYEGRDHKLVFNG